MWTCSPITNWQNSPHASNMFLYPTTHPHTYNTFPLSPTQKRHRNGCLMT